MAHEKLLFKTPVLSTFNFSPVQVRKEILKKKKTKKKEAAAKGQWEKP